MEVLKETVAMHTTYHKFTIAGLYLIRSIPERIHNIYQALFRRVDIYLDAV